VNTYIVLLSKMNSRAGNSRVEAVPLPQIPQTGDVQILDMFAVAGMFDAVLICRAPTNRAMAQLLNALAGWHTDTLLATGHVRVRDDLRIFERRDALGLKLLRGTKTSRRRPR
jgi:hypothetical protein